MTQTLQVKRSTTFYGLRLRGATQRTTSTASVRSWITNIGVAKARSSLMQGANHIMHRSWSKTVKSQQKSMRWRQKVGRLLSICSENARSSWAMCFGGVESKWGCLYSDWSKPLSTSHSFWNSMLFPISDDDRDVTSISYVTYGLVAANIVFFLIQMANPAFTYGWSVVPKEITTGVDLVEPQIVNEPGQGSYQIPQSPGPPIIWLTLLTSMFMHGGFGHISGNMLYLWIFGNNVEHRFGRTWFLIFYLLAL